MGEVFRLLNDEIRALQSDINIYREKMDLCIEFSKEYWNCRDKYHDAFIKREYLKILIKKIREECLKNETELDPKNIRSSGCDNDTLAGL